MSALPIKSVLYGLLIGLVLGLLWIFMPDDVYLNPLMTPEAFLGSRPSLTLWNGTVLIVPSSSLIVLILGLQVLFLGGLFLKDAETLWGVSLLFWGVGTILAGISYQSFGYALKCDGHDYCLFTSWFELAYLFMTAISLSFMTFAFAKTFTTGAVFKGLVGYGKVALIVYPVILVLGAVMSNAVLLSYELFTVFYMPLFLVFFLLNGLNIKKTSHPLDQTFIRLWLLFLLVNVAYYVYLFAGFTPRLYAATGLWFSANDVLHVALILWFGYFQWVVRPALLHARTMNP